MRGEYFDIAALGELLVDLTETGRSPNGMRLYEQNPGGAPANVLTAASKFGMRTAFIGKVGLDAQGHFLRGVLRELGISVRGLLMADEVFTTLAFVSLTEAGEREFSFARKPGADACLRPEELDKELLANCRVFHFGSLSLTDEPSRAAAFVAVNIARSSGAVISFDPNYRAPLWHDEKTASEMIKRAVSQADLVKLSEEEAQLLTGSDSIEKALDEIMALGVKCVVITLGAAGAAYAFEKVRGRVPAFTIDNVVDTTGAGDAFWGVFLSRLAAAGSMGRLLDDIEDHIRIASAAAALCVTKRGAIPAMPDRMSVIKFLKQRGVHLE